MSAEKRNPRLDEGLVTELTERRPDLQAVITKVHELTDFFMNDAAADFAVPAPTLLRAKGAKNPAVASSRLSFFRRLLTLRSASLISEAIPALNEARLLSFALAARGLLETAALGAYHGPKLEIALVATDLPGGYMDSLRAAVMSSRFDWVKYLSDHATRQKMIDEYSSAPREQAPADQATNVFTMVDRLADRLEGVMPRARGIVHLDYALLSDLCHPAAGSNLVFLTGASDQQLTADLHPPRTTRLGFAEALIHSLGYSASTVVEVLAALEESNERLDRM